MRESSNRQVQSFSRLLKIPNHTVRIAQILKKLVRMLPANAFQVMKSRRHTDGSNMMRFCGNDIKRRITDHEDIGRID